MHDDFRPVRVAMLTHGFHIGGGVPSVTRWLSSSLRETGYFEVDVFDLATSSRDANSRRLTKPTSWTKTSLHSACPERQCRAHFGANAVELEFMRYLPRVELTRAMKSYDLVQVVSGSPAWAAPLRLRNTPVVLQAATTVAWERGATRSAAPPAVRKWRSVMTQCTTRLESRGVRNADAVMVENQEMADHVRRLTIRPVHVAPPGVDTSHFKPAGTTSTDGYLLSVSRLGDPRKGLVRMVHVYHQLTQQRGSVPDLVIAGRGPLHPSISSTVAQLKLEDRVHFKTDVTPTDLADLYRGAAVFLQTSFEEGLGISVLEAMSTAVPVVATRTAGTAETVTDGVSGWLVDQDDELTLPTRFAGRVLEALGPANRAMGQAGRTRVIERFSTTAALQRFVAVYSSLLGRKLTDGE